MCGTTLDFFQKVSTFSYFTVYFLNSWYYFYSLLIPICLFFFFLFPFLPLYHSYFLLFLSFSVFISPSHSLSYLLLCQTSLVFCLISLTLLFTILLSHYVFLFLLLSLSLSVSPLPHFYIIFVLVATQ